MTGMPLASADVRRHNLGLVLERVLTGVGAARADIAAHTGLSRGAVTSLVADLVDAGLVQESESVAAVGKGRPRTMLRAADSAPCLVTALLDADHATVVACSLSGAEITRAARRHHRPMGDPEAIADVLAEVLDDVGAELDRRARRTADLAVVVWAPVGGEPIRVLADTDLEWGEVDLLGLLRARSAYLAAFEAEGGAARLTADSDVAVLAEHASVGSPARLLYLKSDSGIGGAIVLADQDDAGVRVLSAAIGHLPVVPHGEACLCGQRGCLVTVAGPDALLAASGLAARAADEGLTSALTTFVTQVRSGVQPASAVWHEAAAEIARTLQILALSVVPEIIVLGGFVAALADDVDAAFGAIQPHIAHAAELRVPRVVGSTLGADAALRGAQQQARTRLLADPLAI
jgi:predicted NBD/HSP70 family sugar kinase